MSKSLDLKFMKLPGTYSIKTHRQNTAGYAWYALYAVYSAKRLFRALRDPKGERTLWIHHKKLLNEL